MTGGRRPAIWGIVNATPDSFSDGGRFATPAEAVARGLALVEQGADVLDVGGESTRPGSDPVSEAEERRRVVPVVEGLVRAGVAVPISVDTRRAALARDALAAGAAVVNDISAGRDDPAMFEVVRRAGAGMVLMHMQGRPRTMQEAPSYGDVVAEVRAWLDARVEAATGAGVDSGRLWIDPGIGFGKRLEDNLALLRALETLQAGAPPLLLGASRKGFLGRLTGREVGGRLPGSLACVARAFVAGTAAVRVHDVAATRDLLTVLQAIEPGAAPG